MKIGIITFHRSVNFGAMLQAYALKKACQKLGHECDVIDHPYSPGDMYSYPYISLYLKKNLLIKLKCLITYSFFYFRNMYKKRKEYLKTSRFQSFLEKYLLGHSTNESLYRPINKILRPYECLITGSDQIWNPNITGGILYPLYFLNIKSYTAKKIAYSASAGANNELPTEFYSELKNYVNSLDSVSCREEELTVFLSELTQRQDIQTVLDPTLLLSEKDWEEIENPPHPLPENYILIYDLWNNPDLQKTAECYAEKYKKNIINIPLYNFSKIGPREFLWYFRHADYIFTDSFHGTAFSINFQKSFKIFIPKKRGSRLLNLLQQTGLCEHMILPGSPIEKINFEIPFDYQTVEVKLNILKEKSISFLKNAIMKKREPS